MTKPELGVKRDCPECGARFYDLNKSPAHCPKCHHEFHPEALLKPRRPREEEVAEPAAPRAAAVETTLDDADREQKGAKSKRKASLDEPAGEDDIEDIEDIDIDDDDDALLEDEDDDEDDVTGIVGGADDDEV